MSCDLIDIEDVSANDIRRHQIRRELNRLKRSLRICASVLTIKVLAKPGRPIIRRCPPAASAISNSSATCR